MGTAEPGARAGVLPPAEGCVRLVGNRLLVDVDLAGFDSVGNVHRLPDVAQDAYGETVWAPGRHGVSNAFYVYLRDPDGHRVEIYTSDYYTGDPDHETFRWDVQEDRRRDYWGNAVIESWYKEATPVLDLEGRVIAIKESAVDESAVRIGADGLGG